MPEMSAIRLGDGEEDLRRAARALQRGQLVAIPTETVYGLAGNALDEDAVLAIFQTKARPSFDPLIVHLPAPQQAASALEVAMRAGVVSSSLTSPQEDTARRLGAAFWPGPLTLVLPKCERVPDLVTSGLLTVAVRFPAHPVARRLLELAEVPLAAPSANRFGRISPTSAEAVARELGDRVPYIVDGGPSGVGIESTVIRVPPDGHAELLRPGGVDAEAAEAVLGRPLRRPGGAGDDEPAAQPSPGRLLAHYAPGKPLTLLERPLAALPSERRAEALPPGAGLLLFADPEGAVAAEVRARCPGVVVRVLSPTGDPAEAARRLFALLRELDESEARLLFAEPCPEEGGLCHAITDRLTRAAHRR